MLNRKSSRLTSKWLFRKGSIEWMPSCSVGLRWTGPGWSWQKHRAERNRQTISSFVSVCLDEARSKCKLLAGAGPLGASSSSFVAGQVCHLCVVCVTYRRSRARSSATTLPAPLPLLLELAWLKCCQIESIWETFLCLSSFFQAEISSRLVFSRNGGNLALYCILAGFFRAPKLSKTKTTRNILRRVERITDNKIRSPHVIFRKQLPRKSCKVCQKGFF